MQPPSCPSEAPTLRIYLDLEAPLTESDTHGILPLDDDAVACTPSSRYERNSIDIDHDLGEVIGYEHDKTPIYNVGTVMVGLQASVLGVTRLGGVVLGRGGRLWRVRGAIIEKALVDDRPTEVSSREEAVVWADKVARAVVDKLVGKKELQVTGELARRYRLLVEVHVERLVLRGAQYGYKVTADGLARAVSARWRAKELMRPRYPSLTHALWVALVLGLPAKDAGDLLVMGGLAEFKVPIVSREVAIGLYHQAVVLLGRMYPEWHLRGGLTDWRREGWTLERLFKGQYTRVLSSAWDRELPVEVLAGVVEAEFMAAAGGRSADVAFGGVGVG